MTRSPEPVPGYRHPSAAAYAAGCGCEKCHPSAAAYGAGCRCDKCLAKRRRAEKIRVIYGISLTDAARVVGNLQKIVAEGWQPAIIALHVGTHHNVIRGLLQGKRQRIKKTTALRILAMTRGDLIRSTKGSRFIPSAGALRRLHALQRMGWSTESLADNPTDKRYLNRFTWMQPPVMHASRYRWIIDLYNRHSMTAGPSTLTQKRAIRKGYPPPLAWDEDTIDDPAAEPQHQVKELHPQAVAATAAFREFDREFRALLQHMTPVEACQHLGLTPNAVYKRYLTRVPNDPIRFEITKQMRKEAS